MRKRLTAFLRRDIYNASLFKASVYFKNISNREKEMVRVNKFNIVWEDAYNNIKFYSDLKKEYRLPNKIKRLEDIKKWPIVTKRDLQQNYKNLKRKHKPDKYLLTGGSTGEPLRLGGYNSATSLPNQWIGRVDLDIKPSSKVFLIWGHQHLYGKGLNRQFNIFKRRLLDSILNYKRVQGYDLSEKELANVYIKMMKFRPELIIGFSPSILAFSRSKVIDKQRIHDLNIKGVVCSGGPLSQNEQHEISTFFGCDVFMEYGSVECGVMAYTDDTDGDYKIFWDTHIIEPIKNENDYQRNIVTRLTKEYTPLIRYDIGDFLELEAEVEFPLRVKNIIGRPSDILSFPGGINIYFALINDIVKQVDKVKAVQMMTDELSLEIHVISTENLELREKEFIKRRCIEVVPDLRNISISVAEKDRLISTIGGKIPYVIKK